jgi:hypothetical protein
MDKAVAHEVLELLNKVSVNLNTSIRVVLHSCPESEFLKYREEVGKIMAEMYFNIMLPIHKSHPELEPEELRTSR